MFGGLLLLLFNWYPLFKWIGIFGIGEQRLVGQGMHKSNHGLFFQGIQAGPQRAAVGVTEVIVQVYIRLNAGVIMFYYLFQRVETTVVHVGCRKSNVS